MTFTDGIKSFSSVTHMTVNVGIRSREPVTRQLSKTQEEIQVHFQVHWKQVQN